VHLDDDGVVRDPHRLAALRVHELVGLPQDPSFARITHLARRLLGAPAARVEVVDDAHADCVLREQRAPTGTRARACLSVPLVLPGGARVGALCVVDAPRVWTEEDVATLEDLAALVVTDVELRLELAGRRHVEADLERSRARLLGILDNDPNVIFAKDLEGRFLVVNRAWERVAGIPAAEATGRREDELFSREHAKGFRKLDREVVATGETRTGIEHLTVDGELRTFRTVKFPLRDERGRIVGVCGVSSDEPGRRRAEARLTAASPGRRCRWPSCGTTAPSRR